MVLKSQGCLLKIAIAAKDVVQITASGDWGAIGVVSKRMQGSSCRSLVPQSTEALLACPTPPLMHLPLLKTAPCITLQGVQLWVATSVHLRRRRRRCSMASWSSLLMHQSSSCSHELAILWLNPIEAHWTCSQYIYAPVKYFHKYQIQMSSAVQFSGFG